jgi:aminoglycoside 6'-N-acetyltransferase
LTPADTVSGIGFRPVTEADFPILRAWLEEPHVRAWWGPPDEEIAKITAKVEGRDSTRPFIIEEHGKPVGYIQYWFVGPHQTPPFTDDHPWLTELPSDAVGIDLSIGDPARLSQGIGSTALALMVEKLRAEGYDNIFIDPDPANTRAVRAYTKAGFRPVPHLEGRTGDELIMQFSPQG